jgi:alpha,alpha-trehalase
MRPIPASCKLAFALALAVASALARADIAVGAEPPPAPDRLYGELFVAVQAARVYPDQKTFVDAVPKGDPQAILERFRAQRREAGFSLKAFVDENFTPPAETSVSPPAGQTLRAHIDWLWPALERRTPTAPDHSSLLPLPKPYVVPGGRFREGYYWDTYFTMLGLQEAGRDQAVDDMLDNFAYEIDRFGHIPNGNRTYYLSRSQPPFFALMVELAARKEGAAAWRRWLPQLRKEHAYWMRGADALRPGQAGLNAVRLPDGALLNRYWDDEDSPRPESYMQDMATAQQARGRPAAEVWRDLRAAAESGWDFSSRWFGDGATLATIRTTAIVPVDLNSLMVELETAIGLGCRATRDTACATRFEALAWRRAEAIERHLWNPKGYYADYDWQRRQLREDRTAAMFFPLFTGIAPPERALATLRTGECALLRAGGISTTEKPTGQQWDAPNGWAPLQWIAEEAARRNGRPALAQAIVERFLARVERVYEGEHKLVEKYVVEGTGGAAGGGEYPLQDGFGWTNGVTLQMLDRREEFRRAPPREEFAPCPAATARGALPASRHDVGDSEEAPVVDLQVVAQAGAAHRHEDLLAGEQVDGPRAEVAP